jgi:hypothetical protein
MQQGNQQLILKTVEPIKTIDLRPTINLKKELGISLLKEAMGKRKPLEYGTNNFPLLRKAMKGRKPLEINLGENAFEPVKTINGLEKPSKKGFREKEAERLKGWKKAESEETTTKSKTGLVSKLELKSKQVQKEKGVQKQEVIQKQETAQKKKTAQTSGQEVKPVYDVRAYDASGTEFEVVREHPARTAIIPGIKQRQVTLQTQDFAPTRPITEMRKLAQKSVAGIKLDRTFAPATMQAPKPTQVSKTGQTVKQVPATVDDQEFGLKSVVTVAQASAQEPIQKQVTSVIQKPAQIIRQEEKPKEKQKLKERIRPNEEPIDKSILFGIPSGGKKKRKGWKGKRNSKTEEFAPVDMPFTSDRSFESPKPRTGFMKPKKQTKKREKINYGI